MSNLSFSLQTGTLYASGDASTFSGTGGPFGFSPYTSQFGGVISSAGLAGEAFDDTVYDVAVGDEVIFVIALQNLSAGARAFDVGVRATLPAGFGIPADGMNLTVADGTGTDLGFSGDLFGAGLRLAGPVAGFNADSGLNVVLVTYTLVAGGALPGPYANVVSTASLSHAAVVSGGADVSTSASPGLSASTTVVTAAPTPVVMAETSAAAVAKGQLIAFDVSVAVPAGTMRDVRLDTVLPGGASSLRLVSVVVTGVGSALQVGSRSVAADGGVRFGTVTSAGPVAGNAAANVVTLRVVVQADGTASGNALLQTVLSSAGMTDAAPRWVATVGSSVGVVVPPVAPGIGGVWANQVVALGMAVHPLAGLVLSDADPGAVATLAVTVVDGGSGRLSSSGAGLFDTPGTTFYLSGSLAVLQAAARQLVFSPAVAGAAQLSVTLVDAAGGVAQEAGTRIVTGAAGSVVLPAGSSVAVTELRGAYVFRGAATLQADAVGAGATVVEFGAGDRLILPGAGGVSYTPSGAGSGVLSTGAAQVTLVGRYDSGLFQASAAAGGMVVIGFRGDPLFDAAYYLAHNPDVAAAGIDPYQHYIAYGAWEGRDPSALFSSSFYLSQNPDVAAAGINPLLHFEASGWREGREPSAVFSDALYLAAYPDVRGAGIDPLLHYVTAGRAEGRSAFVKAALPADVLMDYGYYYARNPDVAAAGMDAGAHYLGGGWREGRNPDGWFDSNYYLTQNPDVRAAGVNPLLHFETSGWREGRQPSLLFDDGAYLTANPDVRAAGINPLAHFVGSGMAEGRQAVLVGGRAAADLLVDAGFYDRQLGATLIPGGAAAAQQAAFSYDATGWRQGLNPDAWFDTGYYLAHNPDVAAAGINPLLHYETNGWREGRDPSAQFSTGKYLAANPDVRAAGLDPLLHYVGNGLAEGRAIYAV